LSTDAEYNHLPVEWVGGVKMERSGSIMTGDTQKDYLDLTARLEELSRLGGIMGVLHWDQEVIMPEGGAAIRGKQMAGLAGVLHEKSTDREMGAILDRLGALGRNSFSVFAWCNIREAKRDYDRETKVPKSLVQEISELASRGQGIWVRARKDNRFTDYAPTLKRMVELKIQWARCIDANLSPYDVNIDVFERGAGMAFLDPIFSHLKTEIVPLIRAIQASDYKPDTSFLKGNFPLGSQETLGRRISQDLGFDFANGRMDVSVHPFCGGGHPTDVRITTRYREDNFVESLYAVVHETGHALYEQGRPYDQGDLPASEAMTMGIHESQSLFWERMVAQSEAFCSHYMDLFRGAFPDVLQRVDVDMFYSAVNVCEPSCIRVEADEVTYPMHVILRYELEKGLFDGSLAVNDLPQAWNEKMETYLGIRPPTDALGVLQDIHWSGGSFGYFPSYSLGAMYACQFYYALKREMPNLEKEIVAGNFAVIKNWLREKIHSQGRIHTTEELVHRVTGQPLKVDFFIDYLRKKYKTLYRLN
jgi:carboxypeptidase Taq